MSTDAVPAKRTTLVPPKFEHVFTVYCTVDVNDFRLVPTGQGSRTNIAVTGGYFEGPDGAQFCEIIPGIGGDHGVVDSKGVFHPEIRFTIQFDDEHYGYVLATGLGVFGVESELTIIIETESTKYADLANRPLYATATLVGNTLLAPSWRAIRSN